MALICVKYPESVSPAGFEPNSIRLEDDGLAKRIVERLEVWQYRREFLEAAQQKVPAVGRYLRRYGMRAPDREVRIRVVREWQTHFNLRYAWAFECAWITLAIWDRRPVPLTIT
jgi:hypothetical protein